MRSLTKDKFASLATFQSGCCVSIYLPTHSSGQEVLRQEDQLFFKNQLKEIAGTLKKRGFSENASQEFLEPLKKLLRDKHFWRNQTNGLAVFAAVNFLNYFHLPFTVKPHLYFSYGFYLKPIIPFFVNNGDNFYLLSLALHEVKLFKGDRNELSEVFFTPPLPQRLEKVLGTDYRPKFLGYHTSKVGGHGEAVFHGHGEWLADEKEEIKIFFRAVNKEIAAVLKRKKLPLIVATQDHLFPLFKEVNTYSQLHPDPLAGTIKHRDLVDLHRESWEILSFGFERKRQKLSDLLKQYHDTDRVSTQLKEAFPAAMEGRVQALFLDEDKEFWGVYHKSNAKVKVQKQQTYSNTSLTNLMAVKVFLSGGDVFLLKKEDLPLSYSSVNALYRH